MKTLISFFVLFSLVLFLLPMAAIGADKPPLAVHSPQISTGDAPASSSQAENMPEQTPPPDASAQETAAQSDIQIPSHFRILDRQTGAINDIAVVDYLYGAVAAEMPPTFHPEALKAQAVASYTYALYCHQHPADESGADFSANPGDWEGYIAKEQMLARYPDVGQAYWQTITDAVDTVSRYILTYEQEPILAAYHAMSAGATEFASNVWNGSLPYLVPVESTGDTLAPNYESTVSYTATQAREILSQAYPGISLGGDTRGWFQIASRSPSGYVLSLQAGGLTISGKEFRSLLGLRSSNFTITPAAESFTITTYGYGHGVGLSQYGADYMARQGSSCAEILAHYYPGAGLCEVNTPT